MRLRRVRQRVRAFVDLAGDRGVEGSVPGRWAMVTLTYAEVNGWSPDDISTYLDCLRHWAGRRGFKLAYVWVAELQERGAVHYHVLAKLPKGITIPMPDKSGMWGHGISKVEWVRKTGKGYLAKYTSKETQKRGAFPRGCRLCGAGGLPAWARQWWTWLLSPQYVRKETTPADNVRRTRGGWRCAWGFIPTPWVATPVPDLRGVLLSRKGEDCWARAGTEPFPAERYQVMERVRDVVTRYCEVMWRYGGEHLRNPWQEVYATS